MKSLFLAARASRVLCSGFLFSSLLGCEAEPVEAHFQEKSFYPSQTPKRKLQVESARNKAEGVRDKPEAPPQRPAPRLARVPTSPDPQQGNFGLKEAVSGLTGKGKLQASIETNLGKLECRLYDDKAPLTVANFVGLARGLRPFWDETQAAWVKRPLYDGNTFHRVIEGFMIQGGDHLGNGTGDVGYNLPDEIWKGTKHDRPGLLCMANKGPNTNGGQFFITDAAAPHLTQMNTYTIFGECNPVELVHTIAKAPKAFRGSEKPEPAVSIQKVTISRR